MIYELCTIGGSVFAANRTLASARRWVEEANDAALLGMWQVENGRIGDLIVLRRFADEAALRAERDRALMSEDPFGAAAAGSTLTMESYAPFPFLPEPRPRAYGGVFEFRTYHLKAGGLPGTMAGWKAAIGPARAYIDHLVINMYALDGSPRITHIWGFASLEERNRLRREHYAAGSWPPQGCPERIDHATSMIALAQPGLPIC